MILLDHEAIGRRIAEYRRLNGWSADELARRAGAGLSRSTIAKVESNRRPNLGIEQFAAIAWALQVPPIALLFPIDRPTSSVDVDGSPLEVAALLDWSAGWSVAGPKRASSTPAGVLAGRRMLAIRNFDRQRRALADLEEEIESTPDESRLREMQMRDLADLRERHHETVEALRADDVEVREWEP